MEVSFNEDISKYLKSLRAIDLSRRDAATALLKEMIYGEAATQGSLAVHAACIEVT
jgi:hypothetical protein